MYSGDIETINLIFKNCEDELKLRENSWIIAFAASNGNFNNLEKCENVVY